MKTAIIGAGSISQTHIKAIKSGEFAKICAICDTNPERLESAAKAIDEKDLHTYTDYKEMIKCEKPDVVHICTPHYLHCEMACFAMENGSHVYLEKPAAMNSTEANVILETSKKTGKKVCVSFQNRVIPTNHTAKQYVEEEKLGKLLGIRGFMPWHREGAYYTQSGWRGTWEKEGGGVLMNQSIHTLDLLYYFGGKVKDVQGSVSLRLNKGTIEVEDTAEATIWFENGVRGIFYATNCYVADASVEVELCFEKGRLLLQNDKLYLNNGKDFELLVDNSDYTKTQGKACWGNGHYLMMDRFYRALQGEDVYYCDISDSIAVLEIIEAVYRTSPNKLK